METNFTWVRFLLLNMSFNLNWRCFSVFRYFPHKRITGEIQEIIIGTFNLGHRQRFTLIRFISNARNSAIVDKPYRLACSQDGQWRPSNCRYIQPLNDLQKYNLCSKSATSLHTLSYLVFTIWKGKHRGTAKFQKGEWPHFATTQINDLMYAM